MKLVSGLWFANFIRILTLIMSYLVVYNMTCLVYVKSISSLLTLLAACVNKGETYAASALAPVCRPTCTEPDKPLYCKAPLGPGCECPDGQVLDTQKAQCVPEKECTGARRSL